MKDSGSQLRPRIAPKALDGHVVEYVYDDDGNRGEVVNDGAATGYTTNEMNQYTDVGAVTYKFDDDADTCPSAEGHFRPDFQKFSDFLRGGGAQNC